MHAFSSYWKERLAVQVNKATKQVAEDERKGKKESVSRPKKIDGKHDIS